MNRLSEYVWVFLILGCLGCRKESGEGQCLIRVESEAGDTKSILDGAAGWDERISEICLFSYESGSGLLEQVVYATGSTATLSYNPRLSHELYVLANLGDLTGAAPLHASDMASFRCTVPSLATMREKGMPMCRKAPLPTDGTALRLRRLLSRLVVSVQADEMEEDLVPDGLYVRQAAGALYPFRTGGSAVLSAEDLASEADQALFPSGGPLILYVPENRQGDLLEADTDSMDKSRSNPRLSGGAYCTYLELLTEKRGTDGVGGDLTYRFFPGENPRCNFDLEGGKSYEIALRLTWNGMFVDGNWKVTRENWNDRRTLLLSLSEDGPFSENLSLEMVSGTSRTLYLRCASPEGSHQEGGWRVRDNDGMGVLPGGSSASCSAICVSVPYSLALPGSEKQIDFTTREGLLTASARIRILSPSSSFSFATPDDAGAGTNTY